MLVVCRFINMPEILIDFHESYFPEVISNLLFCCYFLTTENKQHLKACYLTSPSERRELLPVPGLGPLDSHNM